MTDVWAEAKSRQAKSPLPIGDDVTEDDESGGVGHLEKVTSRHAVRTMASNIFKK